MKPYGVSLRRVALDGRIRRDGTQARAAMDPETVERYADRLRCGDTFPPLILFWDGEYYWVGAGHHRIEAALRIGLATFKAEVRKGGQRDARFHSITDNATHGLNRTTADKKRAVTLLLEDPDWGKRSLKWIADTAKVSWFLADQVRALVAPLSHRLGASTTNEARDGRPFPATTGRQNIRRANYVALLIDPDSDRPNDAPAVAEPQSRALAPAEPSDRGDSPELDRRDRFGQPIPGRLADAFAAVAVIRPWHKHVIEAVSALERFEADTDVPTANWRIARRALMSALRAVKLPYCVCPGCEGKGCTVCRRGYFTREEFAQQPERVQQLARRRVEPKARPRRGPAPAEPKVYRTPRPTGRRMPE